MFLYHPCDAAITTLFQSCILILLPALGGLLLCSYINFRVILRNCYPYCYHDITWILHGYNFGNCIVITFTTLLPSCFPFITKKVQPLIFFLILTFTRTFHATVFHDLSNVSYSSLFNMANHHVHNRQRWHQSIVCTSSCDVTFGLHHFRFIPEFTRAATVSINQV